MNTSALHLKSLLMKLHFFQWILHSCFHLEFWSNKKPIENCAWYLKFKVSEDLVLFFSQYWLKKDQDVQTLKQLLLNVEQSSGCPLNVTLLTMGFVELTWSAFSHLVGEPMLPTVVSSWLDVLWVVDHSWYTANCGCEKNQQGCCSWHTKTGAPGTKLA
jgi:hypothetical protein